MVSIEAFKGPCNCYPWEQTHAVDCASRAATLYAESYWLDDNGLHIRPADRRDPPHTFRPELYDRLLIRDLRE